MHATQIIKAANWKNFIEQLNAMGTKLTNRSIAYLGLCGEGAVADVTGSYDAVLNLKVGEKLEVAMSPETRALAPSLIKSIHLVNDDIIVNGSENLFHYAQAEEIIRGIATWMRTNNYRNMILGGVPNGYGCWYLPKTGTPVTLSSFGWSWVLPYEGNLLACDTVTGGCYYLNPEYITKGLLGRQYWTQFWAPVNGARVVSFAHRVRDGFLYATIRTGLHTMVEAWDVRPLVKGGKIVTNALNVSPEWTNAWNNTWAADLVGPTETGNTLVLNTDTYGVTFYGVAAPTTTTHRA